MKFFDSHVPTVTFADAIDNRLTPDERNQMQKHLNDCAHCAAEFAVLEKSIGLMRRARAVDAPAEALNFAKNIFRAQQRAFAPRQATVGQKIAAVLKMDLSALNPVFGERSALMGEQRQMLFSAGEHDVDLRVRLAGERLAVSGQVLGEIVAGESFARLSGENFDAETEIDELGEFTFRDVVNGNYELKLKIGSTEVAVSNLQL
jgi:anti-sigma factor RsiW